MSDSRSRSRKPFWLITVAALLLLGSIGIEATGWLPRLLLHRARADLARQGGTLVHGPVAGGLFSPAIVEDLRIRTDHLSLTAPRVTARLRLRSLFSDEEPLLRTLALDRAEITARKRIAQTHSEDGKSSSRKWLRRLLPSQFTAHHSNLSIHFGHRGSLRLEELKLVADESATGTFQAGKAVAQWDNEIRWNQDRLTATTGWKHYVLYLADLSLAAEANIKMASLDLNALTLGRVEASLSVEGLGGGLRADLAYAPDGPNLDAALTVWNMDLQQGRAFAAWGMPARGQINEGKLAFRGNPRRPLEAEASILVRANDFTYKNRTFKTLSLGATLTRRWLQIYEFRLQQEKNSLSAQARGEIPRTLAEALASPFQMDINLQAEDLAALASLGIPAVHVAGQLSLEGSLGAVDGRWNGMLHLNGGQLAYKGVPLGDATGEVQFANQEIRIEQFRIGTREDYIEGRATLETSPAVRYKGELRAAITDVNPFERIAPRLFGAQGLLRGSLKATWSGDGNLERHSGAFSISGASLQYTLPAGAETIPLSLDLEGTYSPQGVDLRKATLTNGPTRLEVSGHAGPNRLDLRQAEVSHRDLAWMRGKILLPVNWEVFLPWNDLTRPLLKGDEPLRVELHASDLDLHEVGKLSGQFGPFSGKLNLSIEATGTPSAPSLHGTVEVADFHIAIGATKLPAFSLHGNIVIEGESAAVEGKIETENAQPAALWGSFPLRLTSLFGGTEPPLRPDEPIQLHATFPELRLEWLQGLVWPGEKVDGMLQLDLHAEGTWADPSLRTNATLRNFSYQAHEFAPEISVPIASLSGEGRTISLDNVAGKAGNGEFELSGEIRFDQIRHPTWNLRLDGTRIPVLLSPALAVSAHASLALTGKSPHLLLSGTLSEFSGKVNGIAEIVPLPEKVPAPSSMPLPEWMRQPFFQDWKLNLAAKSVVSLASLNHPPHLFLADLHIHGPFTQPIVNGNAKVLSAHGEFPGARVSFHTGEIRFSQNHPPMLHHVRATLQETTSTIMLQLDGAAAAPSLTVFSIPELPHFRLLSILTDPRKPSTHSGEDTSLLAKTSVPAFDTALTFPPITLQLAPATPGNSTEAIPCVVRWND